MRKILVLFLLSFIIFQFACAEDNTSLPNEWYFGALKEGDVVEHSFTLKNATFRVLNITGVNSSCGCTTSQVLKKSLAPEESTEINVVFDSKGYSGEVKQFVYVNTDNPDMPVVKFTLKAEVERR